MTRRIELLAPAKDAATAKAAISCGADAVYMGAEKFGAREAAGNSVEAIQEAIDFAHQYYAKVYVTLNTLLYDEELEEAQELIEELYDVGVDGVIIQDAGLLEMKLPPLPLIASTQMNNDSPQKVKFLQDVGFSRAILARELNLDEIKEIRKETTIELECFIHGALCVGKSGLCLMSYAIGGRSPLRGRCGNRGDCAQPCRRIYSVKDAQGKTIVKDRYLLSLKDLNLSEYLEDMIDAGVNSFKIEGRLKDIPYVVNTVSFYRRRLDEIIAKKNLKRASSGTTKLSFEPNLDKTFNRGFTDYGMTGKTKGIGSIDTPKSMGEYVGVVKEVVRNYFILEMDSRFPPSLKLRRTGRSNDNETLRLHNADGICFFDKENNLTGTVINGVEENKVFPQKIQGLRKGLKIYRNFDYEFSRKLTTRPAERKIGLVMVMRESADGLILTGTDEDCNETAVKIEGAKQPAEKKEAARQTVINQLTKLGNTIFECSDVKLETQDDYFLPVSRLNEARRELVERLIEVREKNRPRLTGGALINDVAYPQKELTYSGNVLNQKAEEFYRRHGVETIEPAAESGMDMTGKVVMTTKYCLREELGLCEGKGENSSAEPLILEDEDGREYEVGFRCGQCGMEIFYGRKKATPQ
jgi:putative protease